MPNFFFNTVAETDNIIFGADCSYTFKFTDIAQADISDAYMIFNQGGRHYKTKSLSGGTVTVTTSEGKLVVASGLSAEETTALGRHPHMPIMIQIKFKMANTNKMVYSNITVLNNVITLDTNC